LYLEEVGGEEREAVDVENMPNESQKPPASKLTIADAAAEYLRKHGGEARAADLVVALQESGSIRPASKNGYNILQNTLSRRTDLFAKSGRGVWKLAELDSAAPNGSHPRSS
jgi:hypothetical protein